MRFMMMVKGSCENEDRSASPELQAAIGELTMEGFKRGVVVEVGGLLPSSKGSRIKLSGGKLTVTDGPFTEAKEVIGGYAIIQVASKAEAIDEGRRFLQVHANTMGPDYETVLEVRQMEELP